VRLILQRRVIVMVDWGQCLWQKINNSLIIVGGQIPLFILISDVTHCPRKPQKARLIIERGCPLIRLI